MPKIIAPLKYRNVQFEAKVAELRSAVTAIASDQLAHPRMTPARSSPALRAVSVRLPVASNRNTTGPLKPTRAQLLT